MPALSPELAARTTASQSLRLSQQARQGLELLAMSLPELRQRLYEELAHNPCIDDIEPTLEKTTVSEQERRVESESRREEDGDYPREDFDPFDGTAAAIRRDEEADERRQRFFDLQTKDETLEEHLLAQLKVSDVAPEDYQLAELLIGDLNDDGWFAGSLPDLVMVTGESEEKIHEVRRKILSFDPAGCCAMSIEECLLAQLDKLDGSPFRDDVRGLIAGHLADVAAGRIAAVERDLGLSHERYADVLRALRTLEPRPGRAFDRAGKSVTYVNPEVHVVATTGGWRARVDDRGLPDIRLSPKYVKMLDDPQTDRETREYIRGRIAAIRSLEEAVANRQQTIANIAQAIVDAQPGFFEKGLKGLKPLTMQEIADRVGVHPTTVSRTVRDKYASTPKGVVELRRFFTSGIRTDSGEDVAKDEVLARVRAVIDAEDKSKPLSDEAIAKALNGLGYPLARRTIAKYRVQMGIPDCRDRRAL